MALWLLTKNRKRHSIMRRVLDASSTPASYRVYVQRSPSHSKPNGKTPNGKTPDAETPDVETPDAGLGPTDFVCQCKSSFRTACEGLPFFKEHEERQYCVLHYPSTGKRTKLYKVLSEKFNKGDFNFRGTWFPADLKVKDFNFDKPVDFTGAVFNGETIFTGSLFHEGADFSDAVFQREAYFSGATFFKEAIFNNTNFRSLAYFPRATFEGAAKFESATFGGEADFTTVTFKNLVKFKFATFTTYLKFLGDASIPSFVEQVELDFQYANIEEPERVSFNSVTLMPHWFVDVDSRKFDFTNVTWDDLTTDQELERLKRKGVHRPHRRLAATYRQLAINAEENHRYTQASDFRYKAMDTPRKELTDGYDLLSLDFWYWLASMYGESIRRAFVVLAALWIFFALSYMVVGFARWEPRVSTEAEYYDVSKSKRDTVGKPLDWERAFGYSFGVLTLQRQEPRPVTFPAQTLVMIETILGPVQAALLALAIRRKFMR